MKIIKCHIISTNRADVGLLYGLIKKIEESKRISMKVIFAGEICNEKDYIEENFDISKKVFIGKNIKFGKVNYLIEQSAKISVLYSDYLENKKKPDFAICLGDRFELLNISQVLTLYRIPIVHIHGGDITYGALDNEVRNSLSKLSKLHCVVSKQSLRNLVKMGEESWRISCVGSPGRDLLKNYRKNISKKQLLRFLEIKHERIAFVAYHPETLYPKEVSFSESIIKSLLENNIFPVVSRPNPDPYGKILRKELMRLSKKKCIKLLNFSLGPKYIAALMENAEIMIGNSSSGIIEASLFDLPVINVGERQRGRLADKNVISVNNKLADISSLIKKYAGKRIIIKKSIYDFGNSENKIIKHILKNFNKLKGEKILEK